MSRLIPIKYHKKNYPAFIKCDIDEVTGHFDSKPINPGRRYSLHTEYSYWSRNLDSVLLEGLDEIKNSCIRGIPQLWKSDKWAQEFAEFIVRLVGDNMAPDIIEVHPPFTDYCNDFATFFSRYKIFEDKIKMVFPKTKILIENRCGTRAGKRFLITDCKSTLEFLHLLCEHELSLRMVLDYPQLVSGERIPMDNINIDNIVSFNENLKQYKHLISGFHMWGKRKGQKKWTSHVGDLDSFFSGNISKKREFLSSIRDVFSDDAPRFFVPEVNSSESDLHSIVMDIIEAGFVFEGELLIEKGCANNNSDECRHSQNFFSN